MRLAAQGIVGISIYLVEVVVEERAGNHDEPLAALRLGEIREGPRIGAVLRDHFGDDALKVCVAGIIGHGDVVVIIRLSAQVAVYRLSGIGVGNAHEIGEKSNDISLRDLPIRHGEAGEGRAVGGGQLFVFSDEIIGLLLQAGEIVEGERGAAGG